MSTTKVKKWFSKILRLTGAGTSSICAISEPSIYYENNGTLVDIPSELFVEIFSFLPLKDLVLGCNCVNIFWYYVIQGSDNIIWKNAFESSCYLSMYLSAMTNKPELLSSLPYKTLVTGFSFVNCPMDHKLTSKQLTVEKVNAIGNRNNEFHYMVKDSTSDFYAISRHGVSKPGLYLFRVMVLARKPGTCIGVVAASDLENLTKQKDNLRQISYYRDGSIDYSDGVNIIDRIRNIPDENNPSKTRKHKVFYPYNVNDIVTLLLRIDDNHLGHVCAFVNGEECNNLSNLEMGSSAFHFYLMVSLGSEYKVLQNAHLDAGINLKLHPEETLESIARERHGNKRATIISN
jgi:hypothetical protein